MRTRLLKSGLGLTAGIILLISCKANPEMTPDYRRIQVSLKKTQGDMINYTAKNIQKAALPIFFGTIDVALAE